MSAGRERLVIFAREPQRGRVKTRLAAGVGEDTALMIYRALAEGVLHAVRGAPMEIVVAYDPAGAEASMRAWLGDAFAYEPQCAGDLGTRMRHAMATAFDAGADRVVLIGTDCPSITCETIRAASATLGEADVVFGPALDGGYYLIGARAVHDILFSDVPWSTARTLAVSVERARSAGLRVALLPVLRDVDTVDDWRAYQLERRGDG